MQRWTSYSSEEFIEDYHAFATRSAILPVTTPKQMALLVRALFALRYKQTPDVGEKRMTLFLNVMAAIEAHHEKLTFAGYLKQSPAGSYSRVHQNLIRALHRLVVEQRNEEPTFEEIKTEADLFAQRN